jgi:hypothetical protein
VELTESGTFIPFAQSVNGFGKQRVTVMGPLSVKVIAVNEYKNDLIEDSLLARTRSCKAAVQHLWSASQYLGTGGNELGRYYKGDEKEMEIRCRLSSVS